MRRSKRGCMNQISRMSDEKRRWMASFSVCSSSTESAACDSAGMVCSPWARNCFQRTSTCCHSSAANRKLGLMVLPARTRASVRSSASSTKCSPPGCSSTTSSSGSRPLCRLSARSWRRQSMAWPQVSSLSISSNRREAGTFSIRSAMVPMGWRVAGSMVPLSLAAKRTARSMRTGSRGSAWPGRRSCGSGASSGRTRRGGSR